MKLSTATRLEDLQVGDYVTYHGLYGRYGEDAIHKIDRLTQTQIIIGNMRFRRDTGREVGQSDYGRTRISITTPADVQRIRRKNLVTKLSNLNEQKLKDVPTESLDYAVKLLEHP